MHTIFAVIMCIPSLGQCSVHHLMPPVPGIDPLTTCQDYVKWANSTPTDPPNVFHCASLSVPAWQTVP